MEQDLYDLADDAGDVNPHDDELYEWALAEAARAGTRPDAIELLACGLGLGNRVKELLP